MKSLALAGALLMAQHMGVPFSCCGPENCFYEKVEWVDVAADGRYVIRVGDKHILVHKNAVHKQNSHPLDSKEHKFLSSVKYRGTYCWDYNREVTCAGAVSTECVQCVGIRYGGS